MEKWPEELPLILRQNKLRTSTETYRMDFPYAGRPYVEPITDDDLIYYTGSIKMDRRMAQRFHTFFLAINKGRDPFIIPIRTEFGIVEQEAQGLPGCFLQAKEISFNTWEYNFNVVIPNFKIIENDDPDYIFDFINIGWEYPQDFNIFDTVVNENFPEV